MGVESLADTEQGEEMDYGDEEEEQSYLGQVSCRAILTESSPNPHIMLFVCTGTVVEGGAAGAGGNHGGAAGGRGIC